MPANRKALPPSAKITVRQRQRLAEWLDAKEKRRTAPVTTGKDGTGRIVVVARTYTAKYRDGSGIERGRMIRRLPSSHQLPANSTHARPFLSIWQVMTATAMGPAKTP